MDKSLHNKLDALFQKQKKMQRDLNQLGEECRRIDLELKQAVPKEVTTNEPTKVKITAPEIKPPPLPQAIIAPEKAAKNTAPTTLAPASTTPRKRTTPIQSKPHKTGEWELNFGKVWLVRIGIVMLLTGLIFLSTYAYKNWLFNAGPAAKVTFFMTTSLILTGLGMWLEKWQDRFRQYGRVLASGGLAVGYYTLYASHFVPSLKLVDSPIFAGLLLTLWAGLMLVYAVWKKSRVVAVMAIGLAFYGTIVNPSGSLSLFSSLLLSAAGMWLMIKFRWVSIGLGTVLASYLAHAFWLGFYPQAVDSSVRFTYLASYWILFTAALALPKAREMSVSVQRALCTINNGAAWCLAVFMIPQMLPHQSIGWISIGVGSLWITLALIARTNNMWNRSLALVFSSQGILIASLGILIESTGYTRFLVMAVEACILMASARFYSSQTGSSIARIFSTGAYLAALSTALPEMNNGQPASWQSYAALALISAIYTALVRRDCYRSNHEGEKEINLIPLLPAALTWIILGTGVFQQWSHAAGLNGLMLTAATLMLAYFLIKHPRWKAWTGDISMLGTFTCFVGTWWYLNGLTELSLPQSSLPWLVIAIFWFMSPQLTRAWDANLGNPSTANNKILEWFMSILFWIVSVSTLTHHITDPRTWLFLGGLIAITAHAAAEYLRRPSIGAPALLFHLGGLTTLTHSSDTHLNYLDLNPALSWMGWIPAVLLLAHLTLADTLWKTFSQSVLRVGFSIGLILAVSLHVFQTSDRPDLILTAIGLGLMAWAYARKDTGFAITGGVSSLVIACITAISYHGIQDWIRYLPILATLIMHALLWRGTQMNENWIKNWKPVRIILITVGLATLIYSSTAHVQTAFEGSGVAIGWALLATTLFCAGLAMRCRPYRLIGLWWLAASVIHVICIDVMKLDTLGRILSFISLGLLLLALGFLYNKFQESIRKFL